MPYVLTPNKLFVKNPDGDGFLPQNIVTDRTTDDAVADIEAAGQVAIDRVNTAVSNAQSDIAELESQEATIANAIASMAELGTDTTLSVSGMAADAKATGDGIAQLKSAISFFDGYVSEISGKNQYNPATVTDGIQITNDTGAIVSDGNREATDYIPVTVGKKVTVTENYIMNGVAVQNRKKPVYVTFYNSSKAFITGGTFNRQDTEITEGCAFIRVSLSKLESGRNYQIELTDDGVNTPYEAYKAPEKKIITNLVTDETEQMLTDLSGIPDATNVAEGKALIAKTVESGKVTEWEFGETGETVKNPVQYESITTKVQPSTEIDKSSFEAGSVDYRDGSISGTSGIVSPFIDIRNAVRIYKVTGSATRFASDRYCLYDKDKNYLVGYPGDTSYTFVDLDGYTYCIPFDISTEGACYIRFNGSQHAIHTYRIVNNRNIYEFGFKETEDAHTDYEGAEQSTLANALNSSYTAIKEKFADLDGRMQKYELIGDTDLIYPYHSAKKVLVESESQGTLSVRGVTVADLDHMGTVAYNKVELVSDYTGKGKKYRVTELGEDNLKYRVDGRIDGLIPNHTYRICLKISDPENDSTGGGHNAHVMVGSTSVRSVGVKAGKEQVFTATFTAATNNVVYIWPFTSYSGRYTAAVGDEFVIEDFYVNEIYSDHDIYSHEGILGKSVNGTRMEADVDGKMFIATGDVSASVLVEFAQSKVQTINGIAPDRSGDLTVKSHLQGKNIVSFGDSITNSGVKEFTDYPYLSSLVTGANVLNVGIGGTSMRYRENLSTWNMVSFAHFADMIVSGDFADVETLGNTSGFEMQARCAELAPVLANVDWDSVDIITLAYGANDHATNALVNYLDDPTDPTNVYKYLGAFRYAIEKLLTAYPRMRVLVLTPVFRYWTIDGNYTDSDTRQFPDMTEQGYSYYYEWGDALMKCAKDEYHIPCVDMYRELCASHVNHEWFSSDGVHPTKAGRVHMGERLGAALISLL